MKIGIASDHAGFQFKETLKAYLIGKGWEVRDFGTNSEVACDYPDFIIPAAKAVQQGLVDKAVIFGGSGNGEAIAANRIHRVRAAVAWNIESAQLGSRHNDANVLSIGARMVPPEKLIEIVEAWLTTPFEGGRHIRRLEKIEALSQESGSK